MQVLKFIIRARFYSNVGCNAEKFDKDCWVKHINPTALACAMQYLSEKGYHFEKSQELICDELESCWLSHQERIRKKSQESGVIHGDGFDFRKHQRRNPNGRTSTLPLLWEQSSIA